MSTPLCDEAYLIQNTGIGNGQYMYWESKEACDQWFLGKKSGITIQNYSRIYGESLSKNKHNVASICVDAPLNDTLFCDYISYHNTDANRWFHAAISNREFVSDNATRLYFAIDYVATYWDTINFKKCFIMRMTGEEAPYTNLLPEPFSLTVIETPYNPTEKLEPDINAVNNDLQDCNFCVCTDMSQDESLEMNKPQAISVSGFPMGGYVKTYDSAAEVATAIAGIVQRTQNYMSKTMATARTVQSIVYAPKKANMLGSPHATMYDVNVDAPAMGKWNKTKNYQYVKIVSATGAELTLDPKAFGTAHFTLSATFSGGKTGNCRLFLNLSDNCFAIGIDSPSWSEMQFGGTAADGFRIISTAQGVKNAVSVMGGAQAANLQTYGALASSVGANLATVKG